MWKKEKQMREAEQETYENEERERRRERRRFEKIMCETERVKEEVEWLKEDLRLKEQEYRNLTQELVKRNERDEALNQWAQTPSGHRRPVSTSGRKAFARTPLHLKMMSRKVPPSFIIHDGVNGVNGVDGVDGVGESTTTVTKNLWPLLVVSAAIHLH
eukprot:TRINITY_DN745_c0_g6_i1.p1 TRINITY_DN745_c0_g6~~TRINITY_DN745_c0_g6_i1.p1  ORF type:complete len:185 (-),score=68.08 TRINITY_DN745_c0_g6_i1:45-518(-)